ncbi:terpenoid synthase [Fomitiporia mediterranea MF3/22]|uniref:terpenoid synthase n=1 Tax=Fomitiporia mediterranea (strain MF3/22) TaxID=694068 RepID=UPI0004408187|nr:terpenoid synthase [Fomitiporia mediterranea MF3/22]EJC98786.1 terpenoid synthase [Fomitiporia mediterranea MF3/22]
MQGSSRYLHVASRAGSQRSLHVTRQCSSAFAHAQKRPTETAIANNVKDHSRPSGPSRIVPTPSARIVDPFKYLGHELTTLRKTLLHLLGSSHPSLTKIAEYYFLQPSKQIRPLLVLLFSHATNGLGSDWDKKRWAAEQEGARGRAEELDSPLSRSDVLNDWNPNMPDHTRSFESVFELPPPRSRSSPPVYVPTDESHMTPALATPLQLLPTQRRLAQIVEMIHVASLLHDDVIDGAALRRGAASAPAAFGNKLAVLAGDFLLGRASAALSRLGSSECVELIAGVIANLVEGEILQMQAALNGGEEGVLSRSGLSELGLGGDVKGKGKGTEMPLEVPMGREMWNVYLKKSYLKTASLIAKSARAAVVLGGAREGEIWKEVAYAYGRNIGIAFQLVDDVLDYEAADSQLGKPGGADLQLGLVTGPALFAWEEHPAMGPLINRKFEQAGDVEHARDLVRRSSGVERTRALAQLHADKAREVLHLLPESDARNALDALAERVVNRTS